MVSAKLVLLLCVLLSGVCAKKHHHNGKHHAQDMVDGQYQYGVWEQLWKDDDLTIMSLAIQLSIPYEELAEMKEVTIFAVPNDVWLNLPQGVMPALFQSMELLRAYVSLHLVPNYKKPADQLDWADLDTCRRTPIGESGKESTIEQIHGLMKDGELCIGGPDYKLTTPKSNVATVVAPNYIYGYNGIVHVIDALLSPEDMLYCDRTIQVDDDLYRKVRRAPWASMALPNRNCENCAREDYSEEDNARNGGTACPCIWHCTYDRKDEGEEMTSNYFSENIPGLRNQGGPP
mmetsp:Transcript_114712/g.161070  ORF Transcript_114712/g.161070 Transcript_114712/m.161070 type:complete len:289 (-) Transcript_114712:54-920(-)